VVQELEQTQEAKATFSWLIHHCTGWQFGEQGVIRALVNELGDAIPAEHRWFVEFGAGDGAELPMVCEPFLYKEGWKALLIEGDRRKFDVLKLRVPPPSKAVLGWVKLESPGTIDDFMDEHDCPPTPGVMVIDVNSIDYYIAAQMKARPYILCIEHMDSACPLNSDTPFVPRVEDAGKRVGIGFELQANAAALDATIPQAGYVLAYRTRVNSIYVRTDVAEKALRKPDGEIRLNLGAGDYNDPRYTPLDIKTGTDIRKLPYADNTVAEVYASHVLEHFSYYERDEILKEWVRVLKPGGLLRIAVPDQTKLANEWLKCADHSMHRHLEMIQCGAHSDVNDVHRTSYTEMSLRTAMHQAGVGNIVKFHPFIENDCANNPMSLNLEGRKRWWPKVENPRVTLILNQPRLAFTGHELKLVELASAMKFDIMPAKGAFWDRDMTITIDEALKQNDPDFLLFSDYDSVFEVEDVKALLSEIANNPTMAAIGCVQMSRHNDEPLVLDDAVDYDGVVVRVKFQHFGLMIIRREVFEEMPQPWFWSVPGQSPSGEWDWLKWARSDADITFWRTMALMGFEVYQHNGVCIGHICQCIKYPRDKGRGVQYVPIENYWRHGKPRDAKFNPDLYPREKAS